MRTRRNWFIGGVAAVCFVTTVALSYLIEPGVRVQEVTLAEDISSSLPRRDRIPSHCSPTDTLARKRRSSATSWNFFPCQLYNPLEMVSLYRIPYAGRF
jgi:hypothetical protein